MEAKVRNYYAIKVTGGQEIGVSLMLEERIKTNQINEIYSIIALPNLKGYIIVEAISPSAVKILISGIRHVRGMAQGLISRDDILKIISKKSVGPTLKVGDMVEVTSGPFRGMQAQVVSVDESKGEVVLNILESAFPLQVTIPVDQVKLSKK
ncbi:transcription elongation factor Spt5 [Acidianus sp. RZ1]|uniref:Transcription elongation factor Spt5 n=1 Tax=Candidatus Acidianus copahuensis TaxID=1160895 RepID=A0A031LQA5_9CREN|nr:transcription elongation factor Spt5 [Acidianus sp. RZ1]EZQ06910.1 antitermination protein NusG [Candidatus Acidianus copahuensis]NON61434.1 transcription elongation factor Spt5 [Acidianus sp. RZ1]